jgi:hypothetical protein
MQKLILPALAAAAIAVFEGATPSAAGVPGAFPPVRFTYADAYRGWPVAPVHRQHPIRGSFLEPRHPGDQFHWGVDINVRDDRPERGAPPGRTHRVYAIESGVVSAMVDAGMPCLQRYVEAGHFSYWHVDATVRRGQYVRAGQPIGWTCAGAWHVHLGEWAVIGGRRTWINPLHRGGKLGPYTDTAPPEVREISFYTPASPPDRGHRLDPQALRGVVDVRARVGDPQSFAGWMTGELAPLLGEHHPYELRVRLRRVGTNRVWRWTVFRADVWLGSQNAAARTPVPFRHHFAPGSFQNVKIPHCLNRLERAADKSKVDCKGTTRFRLFARSTTPYWDTRTLPNGRYRIEVRARDVSGNEGSGVTFATVSN